MPLVRSPLRCDAGRLTHHSYRSAAGGRVSAGGHQHGLQSSLVGHQPGPGRRRSEDRAIPTSSGNRDAQSPGGSRTAQQPGSAYIRKVHFRDTGMIKQIESKVVNRLRQVTSAIKQDGANQVSIIASTAERQAAVEFAKAAAIRPAVVGEALHRISADADVSSAMFEILEAQKIIEGEARITLLPKGNGVLGELLASAPARGKQAAA